MAIEIVDLPTRMVIFNSYVSLSEGICYIDFSCPSLLVASLKSHRSRILPVLPGSESHQEHDLRRVAQLTSWEGGCGWTGWTGWMHIRLELSLV